MEIPINDLPPVLLDYALAVALKRYEGVNVIQGSDGPICVVSHERKAKGKAHSPFWFRPSQYWGQGGPLIAEFELALDHDNQGGALHGAMAYLLCRLTKLRSSILIPDGIARAAGVLPQPDHHG